MQKQQSVPAQVYNRLTRYLNYLKLLPENGGDNISATMIAEGLKLNDVLVRKDLAKASSGGKPRIGYKKKDLIEDIEHFLGYDNCSEAALVGVGNLGKALLSYENFGSYGLRISTAFDSDPSIIGTPVNGIRIMSEKKIVELCRRLNIHIGIITVPMAFAQNVCDALIEGGVLAIWNFTPANLKTPDNVAVKNEDMAASLSILSRKLEENIRRYQLLSNIEAQ